MKPTLAPSRPTSTRAGGIPGLQVALRQLPGGDGGGSDFVDVVRTDANAWLLTVADVTGKEALARQRAARVRRAVREGTQARATPADVVRHVNGKLLTPADAEPELAATTVARLEHDRCGLWATMACAGSPQPILVRRAGWIDVRGQLGTALGSVDDPVVAEDRVGLGPGDALVFFTNGVPDVVDAKGELLGAEALPAMLLGSVNCDADRLADRVIHSARDAAAGPLRDDLLVLVVRVPADAGDDPDRRLEEIFGAGHTDPPLPGYPVGEPHWGNNERPSPPREARLRLEPEPRDAARARRFVEGVLHSWRMSELTHGDIELCTSEIVTNALRYADSTVTVIASYDGGCVRIEVGDGSRALPRRRVLDNATTGGRGIAIVDALAARWGVVATVEGKRVWFEIPAGG